MPALAQDLIEPFRAPVADSLALSLVNLGVLKESDFTQHEGDGGVFLSKEALAVYFRHFRRRMTSTYQDRSGNRTSLRRELLKQCAHVRRVYLGEEEFQPFVYQAGGKNRETGV